MTEKINELVEKKIIRKKKYPKFERQRTHTKKRLGNKWRKPKGIQSKLRRQVKGHSKLVRIGYGGDKRTKGMDRNALIPSRICNLKDLKELEKDKNSVIISHKVGLKNKLTIIKECLSKGFNIQNIKNPEKYMEDKIKARDEEKKNKQNKKIMKETKRKTEKEKKKAEKEKQKKEKKEAKQEKKEENKSESKVEKVEEKKVEEKKEDKKPETKKPEIKKENNNQKNQDKTQNKDQK